MLGGRRRRSCAASSTARSECSRATSSSPRWTAITAIGRWSCGTSSPYWIAMSCECAACAPARCQFPAQNSTQARPQSARALRGSSRSCQSPVLPLEQRARLLAARRRRIGVHDRLRPLLDQPVAAEPRLEAPRPGPAGRRSLVRALEPAEEDLDGSSASAQRLVAQPVRQLERARPRGRIPDRKRLAQASRQQDQGLEGGVPPRPLSRLPRVARSS